jgi:hypothetical protein
MERACATDSNGEVVLRGTGFRLWGLDSIRTPAAEQAAEKAHKHAIPRKAKNPS